jgi:ribose transport system substrate-binding protein
MWVGLFAALLLTGCAGGDDTKGGGADGDAKRIILLNNGPSPFWDAARVGMRDASDKLELEKHGLRAVFEDNDSTSEGQLNKLRQYASQTDVAAVAISAETADNAAVASQMANMQAKGIKIITFDSDVDRAKFRDSRFAFVGTDNLVGGRELGKCLKNLRPQGGGYVTFVGRTNAQNAIDRINGVKEGAGDKWRQLDSMPDETDRSRAKDNVRNAIGNHGDELKALVGIWSYNAPQIVDVVTEMKNRSSYTIVTFDAEPQAITAEGKGMIDTMVVQNPYSMGYNAVRLLKALVEDDQATVKEMLPNHGQPDGDLFDTGIKVVVPERSPLKKEMFSPQVEFLKLPDFRKWLDKYHLKQS